MELTIDSPELHWWSLQNASIALTNNLYSDTGTSICSQRTYGSVMMMVALLFTP
jgi:hypothetical protein